MSILIATRNPKISVQVQEKFVLVIPWITTNPIRLRIGHGSMGAIDQINPTIKADNHKIRYIRSIRDISKDNKINNLFFLIIIDKSLFISILNMLKCKYIRYNFGSWSEFRSDFLFDLFHPLGQEKTKDNVCIW